MNLALVRRAGAAARGRAQRAGRASRPSRPPARRSRTPSSLPDLWPTAVEAGWTGLVVAEERGGAGPRRRSTRCSWRRSAAACWPPCRCSATCWPPTCSTARGYAGIEALAVRRASARRSSRPARPTTCDDALDGRARRAAWAAPTAPTVDGSRRAQRRRLVGARRRRAPTCSSSWRPRTASPSRSSSRAPRSTEITPLRRDALAGPRRARRHDRHGARRRRGRAGQRLVPRAGAARAPSRVGAVETCLAMARRVRQGALHVRPRDRLLPGGQALAHRDPAPPGERPLAAALRGLGRRGQARGVPDRRQRGPGRRGQRPRPRRADEHRRPRRHRRDLGARRAAVLPPRRAAPSACSAAPTTRTTASRAS